MLPPEAKGYQMKIWVPDVNYHSMSCRSGIFQRPALKPEQTIAIPFACPPELDGKTILLKTTDALVIGHREIKP